MAADAPADEEPGAELEDDLDELVRREVLACFAGMETALATGDEKAALALIQTQGKQVLNNVLAQLEDDGKLLSGQLSERIEELATGQRSELLEKYDEQLAGLQETMAADRAMIQEEAAALEKLKREYAELQAGGGGGFNRDKIVSGVSFVIGLTGVASAANELAKIAFGAGGDLPTVGINAALGAVGIGYYFVRKGGSS